MIGVIAGADQLDVVAEFFELFKTPWEIYRPEGWYDVVLTTGDRFPANLPRLLVVCGNEKLQRDCSLGCEAGELRDRAGLLFANSEIPIYCGLRTLEHDARGRCLVETSAGAAVVQVDLPEGRVIRAGYDLFNEIRFLLSEGQPSDRAQVPTLDIHIRMLRHWILSAGIPLLEIAPAPAGHDFAVCLTHDIDFTALRNHKFDRSFWGFVYRASIGSLARALRGRLSVRGVLRNWAALAASPFVLAGWVEDFWEPFGWYLEAEDGLPATYYLIPFKGRPGKLVPGSRPSLRAAAYDVADLAETITVLLDRGCEVGVHGLDAWHSVEGGLDEIEALRRVTGEAQFGIRMHWLLWNRDSPSVLERAGFAYDSTFGYNETVGYRAGTTQVYRPIGAQNILEVPLHIQDGALFYPQRLNLTEPEATERCSRMIADARQNGGVLTLLWHDRSHGPERLWGSFYRNMLQLVKHYNPWFATGSQAAAWFQKRRSVKFASSDQPGRLRIYRETDSSEINPPLSVQILKPEELHEKNEDMGKGTAVAYAWNGKSVSEMEAWMASVLARESEETTPCVSH